MQTPPDLSPTGAAFWQALTDTYDFEAQDVLLLVEACRVKDRLDSLDEVVRREGPTIESPQGVRAHPALVESRQQQLVLSRLLASLRLPDEEGERAQRRGRARGAYGTRSRAMANR